MLMMVEVGYDYSADNKFSFIEAKPMIVEDYYKLFPSYVEVKNLYDNDRVCDMVSGWHRANNGMEYKYALVDAEKYLQLGQEKTMWAVVEGR